MNPGAALTPKVTNHSAPVEMSANVAGLLSALKCVTRFFSLT